MIGESVTKRTVRRPSLMLWSTACPGAIGLVPQVVHLIGARRPELGHAQFRRQAIFTPLGAILQQQAVIHADAGHQALVIEEGPVVHH
jgi:hypothetical protein